MEENLDFKKARELLLGLAAPVDAERLPLSRCAGRVLAEELTAREDVPGFDRSPYDGYAFIAEDSAKASPEHPVTLRILEEVAAGAVPTKALSRGSAVKILTGAPIPPGADAVVMYERTRFTRDTVTLLHPAKSGENIVRAGEDVKRGALLSKRGVLIDAGLIGSLASQGIAAPLVYKKPKIGLISTGSELVEPDEAVFGGKIRNSNRYTLTAALESSGCNPVWLGIAGDNEAGIAALIGKALSECDAVLLTGGVSAGDYDLTPAAMERSGARILRRGVDLKPGMACAYGVMDGKLICALSGNPASALTNFLAVVRPAFLRLAGRADALPEEFPVVLAEAFPKGSKATRLLHGTLSLSDGTARMQPSAGQGNAVISGVIGCDVLAIVPAGSGALCVGDRLMAFMI